MKALTAESLAPLLNDRNRESTEVLVRVPPALLGRFAGWLREKERDDRGKRTAQGFRRLLESLHIPEQILEQIASESGENPVDVNDLLLGYLQLFSNRFKFVHTIPVRENYFAPIRYVLVHGTDSEHGIAHMNDVVSSMEDELYVDTQEMMDRGQGSLFGPSQREPRAMTEDAEAAVLEYLNGKGAVPFIGIRAALALRFGPDLREKHHKKAINNLLGRGALVVAKDNPKMEKRSYRLAAT